MYLGTLLLVLNETIVYDENKVSEKKMMKKIYGTTDLSIFQNPSHATKLSMKSILQFAKNTNQSEAYIKYVNIPPRQEMHEKIAVLANSPNKYKMSKILKQTNSFEIQPYDNAQLTDYWSRHMNENPYSSKKSSNQSFFNRIFGR